MADLKQPIKPFDYKASVNQILKSLRRDRDRQILARRFGFGLPKRQTLERIGQDFGITRERVRQIEKAAIAKIRGHLPSEADQANQILSSYLQSEGGVALIGVVGQKMGADTAGELPYVVFLASLVPDVELIEEDDHLKLSLALNPPFNRDKIKKVLQQAIGIIREAKRPLSLVEISRQLPGRWSVASLRNLLLVSKQLAKFDDQWGLISWPEVNPKSIRDKTYLVLKKQGKPLHFSEIAEQIKALNVNQRQVTVQAVHNELIKDPRFVLIGRGIYALAEWGYTPGTVADIIVDILKEEAPLHKDEIVKRVLAKRQVKTATIILNLQEKNQFERVAKATYKLKAS